MSFHSKEERPHVKNRKQLTSSTNSKDSLSRKQKSYSKKEQSSIVLRETLMNRSTGDKSKQQPEEIHKTKEPFLQKYLDKYKRQKRQQFPNISMIEEKESIISNNQENSLDSLNNFIIQGDKKSSSMVQKSNKSNSYEESRTEDWSLLQNQYFFCVNKNQQNSREAEYLEILNELRLKPSGKTEKNDQQNNSPILDVTQKIRNLQEQISKLKLKNSKKSINEQSSQVLDNIGASHSYNQQKSLILNQKSLEFKTSNQIFRKSEIALQRQESLHSNSSKPKIRISQDQNQKNHTSDRLLQHLQEEENKEFIEEQSPSARDDQTEKDQEQFIKYMDKKELDQNQPNLSLNNISKIMVVRAKEPHNKSIENQNQIKQKEDDEVVAMLENQLRGKKIVQIPQTEETQIILKESRDNMCLNELENDIQNNIQTSQIQEEAADENKKNFFIALQAREKWIKSLEKDQNWKSAELALLSKMKKILHNPYIEFPEN